MRLHLEPGHGLTGSSRRSQAKSNYQTTHFSSHEGVTLSWKSSENKKPAGQTLPVTADPAPIAARARLGSTFARLGKPTTTLMLMMGKMVISMLHGGTWAVRALQLVCDP